MHCCTSVTGCYHRHKNDLTFMNVLKKYTINEDIVLNYVLHENAQTSTKDWIGIFPRGWTNLQQYLTFEYALVAPREASLPNRSILFLHTFHQEASPNVDYQFVYVSKQIQILGTSSYFRFTLSPDSHQFGNNYSNKKWEKHMRLAGYPPAQVMSDDSMNKSYQQESSVNLNGTLSSHSAGAVSCLRSRTNGIKMGMDSRIGPRRICQNCEKPMDHSKLALGRARSLVSHNSLVARVARLERDLELAEGSVKHARMARANLTNRLRAYESFVTEMLKSLALKGIVKIMDAQGKEIILKRVNTRNLSENPEADINLRNESGVLEGQEQSNGNTITDENRKDLIIDSLHIEEQSSQILNSGIEKFVQHGECVDEKSQTTADIRTQTAKMTCDKYTEMDKGLEFPEGISEDKNNERDDIQPIKDKISFEKNDENPKERESKESRSNLSDNPENCHQEDIRPSAVCIEHDQRDVMREEQFLIRAVQSLTENQRENEDSLEILPSVDTLVKPSAIVLRDGNMKFAIIRY
ncbi:uncharacterized protein LOC107265190 isoform X2 [Cephus cinctus]|uniref:Uncharacterized protein LOC107265190 isoform X2 n=1 Tax=Cephus cinctus TaxID=211228 RepID=A0AAJ7FFX6_CEPCN|nr:uncharacterized protein LOC107265190 isoform X2 [Cephus cinctus]